MHPMPTKTFYLKSKLSQLYLTRKTKANKLELQHF